MGVSLVCEAILAVEFVYLLGAIATHLCIDLRLSVSKLGAVVSTNLEPRHPGLIVIIVDHQLPLLLIRRQDDFVRRHLVRFVLRLERLLVVVDRLCNRIFLKARSMHL